MDQIGCREIEQGSGLEQILLSGGEGELFNKLIGLNNPVEVFDHIDWLKNVFGETEVDKIIPRLQEISKSREYIEYCTHEVVFELLKPYGYMALQNINNILESELDVKQLQNEINSLLEHPQFRDGNVSLGIYTLLTFARKTLSNISDSHIHFEQLNTSRIILKTIFNFEALTELRQGTDPVNDLNTITFINILRGITTALDVVQSIFQNEHLNWAEILNSLKVEYSSYFEKQNELNKTPLKIEDYIKRKLSGQIINIISSFTKADRHTIGIISKVLLNSPYTIIDKNQNGLKLFESIMFGGVEVRTNSISNKDRTIYHFGCPFRGNNGLIQKFIYPIVHALVEHKVQNNNIDVQA